MKEIIEEVIKASPMADCDKASEEASLFSQSVLTNCLELDRLASRETIARAWERWKRERGYPNNEVVDLENPYIEIKFRKK